MLPQCCKSQCLCVAAAGTGTSGWRGAARGASPSCSFPQTASLQPPLVRALPAAPKHLCGSSLCVQAP